MDYAPPVMLTADGGFGSKTIVEKPQCRGTKEEEGQCRTRYIEQAARRD
jgi:hypothetical protein